MDCLVGVLRRGVRHPGPRAGAARGRHVQRQAEANVKSSGELVVRHPFLILVGRQHPGTRSRAFA
eukprot:4386312-Pyramimonas_sp.AAC.1